MKMFALIIVICAIGFLRSSVAAVVDIPDADLRSLIEEALSKETDAPITEEELLTLTVLHASPGNISDLPPLPADLNEDGVVNIQDLVLVASRIGHPCPNEADINGDAVINVQDLVLVAQSFGNHPRE